MVYTAYKQGKGANQWAHKLMGTRVLIAFDRAPVEIVARMHESELRENHPEGIIPDIYLLLRHRREEAFFVEIDTSEEPIERSNKDQTCLLEKMLRYYTLHAKIKEHYQINTFLLPIIP